MGYVGGSFYALKAKTPIIVMGFLIGVTLMLAILDLMTAVYWGQLSHCTRMPYEAIDQYSCHNRTTYGAVSVFATILLMIKSVFLGALVYWHDDLIDETDTGAGRSYDQVLQRSTSGGGEGDTGGGEVYGRNNQGSESNKYSGVLYPQSDIEDFEEESFSI